MITKIKKNPLIKQENPFIKMQDSIYGLQEKK